MKHFLKGPRYTGYNGWDDRNLLYEMEYHDAADPDNWVSIMLYSLLHCHYEHKLISNSNIHRTQTDSSYYSRNTSLVKCQLWNVGTRRQSRDLFRQSYWKKKRLFSMSTVTVTTTYAHLKE